MIIIWCDVDAKDTRGQTGLVWAAKQGRATVITSLASAMRNDEADLMRPSLGLMTPHSLNTVWQAALCATDVGGWTAFNHACHEGKVDCVLALLSSEGPDQKAFQIARGDTIGRPDHQLAFDSGHQAVMQSIFKRLVCAQDSIRRALKSSS